MIYKDRLELFKEELELIENEAIKEFTMGCIKQSPDYVFEDCPSSSSGKYHPIDELGADGNILHTKKAFALAYELSRAFGCEHHRDEICSAVLLHDLAKQGLKKTGHTVKTHPQIMAKLIADVYTESFTDKLDREIGLLIYYCVFYHYGPWTERSVNKPLSEYTKEELTVYISDYISSKRFIHVDYKRDLGGFKV
jgi:23S rRNA maturation-related 3'-5' exoribonuclease YhaM